MLAPWKKSYDQPRQHIKKQRHYFANKGPSSQSYGFSSGHVWMWELNYKKSWVPKNWCFWTVVLEKTLESPLDCKEIQPVLPKGNQSWIFIGRTDAEAETSILWPPDVKNQLIRKRPWYWERLKAGGEGNDRGWDGWMASSTRWTWVWVGSRSWWWTEKPGVLQSMGSQRVRHDWTTELNWPLLMSLFPGQKWASQQNLLSSWAQFLAVCTRSDGFENTYKFHWSPVTMFFFCIWTCFHVSCLQGPAQVSLVLQNLLWAPSQTKCIISFPEFPDHFFSFCLLTPVTLRCVCLWMQEMAEYSG